MSVIENLKLPKFDPKALDHQALARTAREVTARGGGMMEDESKQLDRLAFKVVSEHG